MLYLYTSSLYIIAYSRDYANTFTTLRTPTTLVRRALPGPEPAEPVYLQAAERSFRITSAQRTSFRGREPISPEGGLMARWLPAGRRQ